MLKIDVEGKTTCNGVTFDTVEILDLLNKHIGAAWTTIPSYMSGDFFTANPNDTTMERPTFLFGFKSGQSTPVTILECKAYAALLSDILKSKIFCSSKQAVLSPNAGVVEAECDSRIAAALVSSRLADSMLRYVGRLNGKAARNIPFTEEELTYFIPKLDAIDEWEDAMVARRQELIAAGKTQVSDDALWPPPPEWLPEFLTKF